MNLPHPLIAVPAGAGTVHIGTMRSIIRDTIGMVALKWPVSIEDEIGSADIYDVRARICVSFLQSKATHLVFIDHDVLWQAGGIPRLVMHDVDVVAGVYPQRKDPCPSYALQYIDDSGVLSSNERGLIEVAGVSAGFMCIKRRVIEAMNEHYKDDPVAGLYTRNEGPAYALWDPYRVPGETRKLGEDYAFCRRWRDMGGKVFIDPDIAMGHVGLKVFSARFFEHLEKKAPLPDVSSAA